jgi:cellobiose-specific phosphotransferase system component IIC
MVFNINERYLFAINLLLAALLIPYFAARTVSAMIKLHYAANVVTPCRTCRSSSPRFARCR